MSKKRICSSCGKMVDMYKDCECKINSNRNAYQRDYYQKNKEILQPLKSRKWRLVRKEIIRRDNAICQRCFIKHGVINDVELQVHHIKPRIKFPELMYERTNLITICKTCNLQLGTAEVLDFEMMDYSKDNETKEFHL